MRLGTPSLRAGAGCPRPPADSREVREQGTDIRFKLAYALYQMGDFPRAMDSFREAEYLGLALDHDDRLGEIYAGMAYLLGSEGDFAGAIQQGRARSPIAMSRGDLALQVWTSIGLGASILGGATWPGR